MIKTGILGYNDQWHEFAPKLESINSIKLIGYHAPKSNPINSNLKFFQEPVELLEQVDAVIALSPMSELIQVKDYVRRSKHVLFQPTKTYSKREANSLIDIIDEANVKVQAGFDKRYHQAFVAAKPFIKTPKLIVSNHYESFDESSNKTSVLMDLLLHDLDLVLSIVGSDIKNIEATSVSIDHSTPDVINARIEFNNRCVAQFNAGKIATKQKNEIFFFNSSDYVYIDLLKSKASLVKKKGKKSDASLFHSVAGNLICEPIPINNLENSNNTFQAFADAILNDKLPDVNVESMMRTYSVALAIEEKLKINNHS